MYDRSVRPVPPRPYTGLKYRVYTLIGITGSKMAKYRSSLKDAVMGPLRVVWRPHLLMALTYEALLFGFSIGINASRIILYMCVRDDDDQ